MSENEVNNYYLTKNIRRIDATLILIWHILSNVALRKAHVMYVDIA